MKRILILLFLGLMIVSCGSKRKVSSKKKRSKAKTEQVVTKPRPQTPTPPQAKKPIAASESNLSAPELYILNYKDIAMVEMRSYKIPASITLAQGILESSSGRGRLAVEANNHFGIKCHDWTGDRIHHDDDALQECFRKYKHANESFEDHSAFLTKRSRYSKLFQLDISDYKGWARELRAAGYATDRKYPEKLISLIERYELYQYDDLVLGTKTSPKASGAITHRVEKGDTLYSLSRRYEVAVEHLQKLNQMTDNTLSVGQILIIKK